MGNIYIMKETTLRSRRSLKLKKLLKKIFSCRKLQIVFRNKTKLSNKFHFRDQIPKDLKHLVSFISFSVDSAMSPIMMNV